MDVSAKQLVKDYKDNEIGADERYKGKVARIKGKVNSISKGPLGGLSISLSGGWYRTGDVVCEFNKSQRKSLAALKDGDEVNVIGRITGRTLNSGSDVNVEGCRIE